MGVSGLVWYASLSQVACKVSLTGFFSSSAKDDISNRTCAVKKLADPFKNSGIAQHMFREIKLLRQLQHDNVCYFAIRVCPSRLTMR